MLTLDVDQCLSNITKGCVMCVLKNREQLNNLSFPQGFPEIGKTVRYHGLLGILEAIVWSRGCIEDIEFHLYLSNGYEIYLSETKEWYLIVNGHCYLTDVVTK